MEHSMRKQVIRLVVGLSFGLLSMGAFRLAAVHSGTFAQLSGFVTPGYVLITVVFTILLVRAGLPHNKFGFGVRLDLRQIILAIATIVILRAFDVALNPLIEEFLGGARNLERFSNVEGSVPSLVTLLIMNWTAVFKKGVKVGQS